MSKTNRSTGFIVLFIVVLIFAGIGCGPPRVKKEMITDECAPSGLIVKPDNGSLLLQWQTNCPPDTLISGYFIYLETRPIDSIYFDARPPKSVKPFNHAAYPGDTDPEDSYETMLIENLDNGTEYFVSVRTIFPDKRLSVSSNQVGIICRPEGDLELAYRFTAQDDGFSLDMGAVVRADSDLNDLYFFSKDGIDYIASPHRLNGFLRTSQFYSLGKTEDIYQHPVINLDYDPVEKMPVSVGESYVIKTADNRMAKIRIEKITGEKKKRRLYVKYIYQTIENLMRF